MAESYLHLKITREAYITPKRPKKGRTPDPPENPIEHGEKILSTLHKSVKVAETEIPGFDDRRLLSIDVDKGFQTEVLASLPGVEVISQENETLLLTFIDDRGEEEFEARLTTMSQGGKPARAELFYTMQSFGNWTAENRLGDALRTEGVPEVYPAVIDIELWALNKGNDRISMRAAFEEWLKSNNISLMDSVNQHEIILYRVRCDRNAIDLLLNHRDVRAVDLPPKYGYERALLRIDRQALPESPAPPGDSPGIVILDSGIAENHPLLKAAIGDAQSFIPNFPPSDVEGHGTHIAGIALYDNVDDCLKKKIFIPELRLFSGRILDDNGDNNTGFIENHIIEAVDYFKQNYGCKVFNLSIGDKRKPYRGGRIHGLAVILDSLVREKDVLFVVSAGNFNGTDSVPQDWLKEYPAYLMCEEARLFDPATAINVLTVGSMARYDQSFISQQYINDPAVVPIARHRQPSPFTRRGPSVNGIIKPEIVGFGGNIAIDVRSHSFVETGLKEVSTSISFLTEGWLIEERRGTSQAAPHIAHLAAKLLREYPTASANLLRALLVSHARHHEFWKSLFEEEEKLWNICGYGEIRADSVFRSTEEQLTFIAEDKIEDKKHHFYEIPIPEDFYSGVNRSREITVALAHSPAIKTTRFNYKASEISFRLIESPDLETAINHFNAATKSQAYPAIPEINLQHSRSSSIRSKGTVQSCTWKLKKITEKRKNNRLFVVVTRTDTVWGRALSEELESYALVINLLDSTGHNVRLYTQAKNILSLKLKQMVKL